MLRVQNSVINHVNKLKDAVKSAEYLFKRGGDYASHINEKNPLVWYY